LSNDFFSQQLSAIDFEGLKQTPWALQRVDLCRKLCEIVDISKRLLVRGPFASGKTALAQLIHHHLCQDKKTAYIVTLAGDNIFSWTECWFKQTGVLWEAISNSEPVYVIIDEVQVSYPPQSSTSGLWGEIKRLSGMNSAVYFICIGSYGGLQQGPSTPIDFPSFVSLNPHNGTPGLAYTPEEFQVLCKLFPVHGGVEIDERSSNYIFHLTGGHPGIIGLILKHIHHHGKDFKSKAKDLYNFLHSAGLHNSLENSSCRAIPDFAADSNRTLKRACKHVLSAPYFKASKSSFNDDELEQQLQNCLRTSVLVEDGDGVAFASPVVQSRALAYYFSETGEKPASLGAFIVEVVQRFSEAQLRESESKDTKSRIMEGQWQQEFYRAAASLLPRDAVISPEYGREQGAVGQVDFYISEYKWMIEILREGLAMSAHERRFEHGGPYAPLLDGVEWCVVDFRATEKQVIRSPRPHTYHVSIQNNLARILNPLGTIQEVSLLGDKAVMFI